MLNLPAVRRDGNAEYDPRVGMERMLNAGMTEDVSFLPIRSSGNVREIVIPLNEPNLQTNNQFQESFLQLLHQIVETAQNSNGTGLNSNGTGQAGGERREEELPPNPSQTPLTAKKQETRPSLMWEMGERVMCRSRLQEIGVINRDVKLPNGLDHSQELSSWSVC